MASGFASAASRKRHSAFPLTGWAAALAQFHGARSSTREAVQRLTSLVGASVSQAWGDAVQPAGLDERGDDRPVHAPSSGPANEVFSRFDAIGPMERGAVVASSSTRP